MIRLGLVGDITDDRNSPSYPAKKLQIGEIYRFLPSDFKVYIFPWSNLTEPGIVTRAYQRESGLVENIPLEEIADIVLTRQLGQIHTRTESFLKYLDRLDKFRGKKVNHPSVMRENLDKKYLIELLDAGYPVVPTVDITGQCIEHVQQLRFSESDEVIIKPRVFGEGGKGVVKLSELSSEDLERRLGSAHIAQPLMSEIYEGEVSLVFLGNYYSHALRKKSTSGSFKINFTLGAKYEPVQPTEEEVKLGQSIITHYGDENHLVRVDLIRTSSGPRIMEVERINPAAYTLSLGIGKEFTESLAIFLRRIASS